MNKKLKIILNYFIMALAFIILARGNTLSRLGYSTFLLFIIINQSIGYFQKDRLKVLSLILLEGVLASYLASISFSVFLLLGFLVLLDGFNYLETRALIIFNVIYLSISCYMLYISFTSENLVAFFLIYLFGINTGFLYRENNKLIGLKDRISQLEYEEKMKILEDDKKNLILRDIYITQERNRISRDLHDSVGHSLSTIIIQLSAIEQVAKQDGNRAAILSRNLRDYGVKAMDEIRSLLKNTKPKDSDENQLIVMLENLIEENIRLTSLDIKLKFSAHRYALDYKLEKLIYNGVKEFISNSIKHSGANRININLFYKEEEVILSMKDNGLGTHNLIKGMGLESLEERVRESGGDLILDSAQGEGFFVMIKVGRKI